MWDWISQLQELRIANEPCALVTVTRTAGSVPREVGAKMIVTNTAFYGTIGGGKLESLVLQDAKQCLLTSKSGYFSYPLGPKADQCCGGLVEIFVDVVHKSPKLYLFGSGHVGQSILQTLQNTPFDCTVIDERDEWRESLSIPDTVHRYKEWSSFIENAKWSYDDTFVVILTHSHELDFDILSAVIEKPTRYLGLIGSDSKWRRFVHRLEKQGVSEEQIQNVTCPIGLMPMGKSPKAVAISFAAQVLSIYEHERHADDTARSRDVLTHGDAKGFDAGEGPVLAPHTT